MDWKPGFGRLRIGGHRGAPDVAPENTVVGFETAAEAGTEYIENDIRRSADGALVVMHDPTVDRTTNGRGSVSRLRLDELRALDAGVRFDGRFAGQRILTLEEFLAWIEGRPPFGALIEAKSDGVGADIARAIAASPSKPYLSICSFKSGEIAAAKQAVPEVPAYLLFRRQWPVKDPVRRLRRCGADGADVPWQWISERIVGDMHEAGLAVGGGTANDRRAVERLVAVGADFVDSDRPALAVAARNELAQPV
jgi:glycerophosphoryl diester phosphodiesterase